MNNQPRYGNWVSQTLLNKLLMCDVILVAMVILTNYIWKMPQVSGTISDVFLIVTLYWAYLNLCRKLLTYDGGGVMEKFHDKLIEKLMWDGEGVLLDVGCGSGALSVKCAKTFEDASIVGIDSWPADRDFSLEQCERNAMVEGVEEQISFEKDDIKDISYADECFDAVVSCFAYRFEKDEPNKRTLIKESLRVLKKGGSFAIVDMIGNMRSYGTVQGLMEELEAYGVSEVHYIGNLEKALEVPGYARLPGMIYGAGMIYGIK